MIVFSVGLPGRFAEWCDAVLARMVECALGSVERIDANRLSEFGRGAMRARSPHRVIASRKPTARIGMAIADANRNCILALDDPYSALHQSVEQGGMDMVDAVRAIACGCASIVEFTRIPRTLVLNGMAEPCDPEQAAMAISRYLGLELTAADLAAVTNGLDDLRPNADPVSQEKWWADLNERDRQMAIGAFGSYARYLNGEALNDVIWEPDLLYITAELQENRSLPALRSADITGRPRCLISGPAISLPSGTWSAKLPVMLSPEAAELGYLVEIAAGLPLTSTRIGAHAGRHVELTLQFTTDNSVEDPLEIRIWNERSAFDGELALGPMTLTPLSDAGGWNRQPAPPMDSLAQTDARVPPC